jgi:site-specific recombinase XerD
VWPTINQSQRKPTLLTKSQARFQRDLLTKFLKNKRPNLSPCTYTLYKYCLTSFATQYEKSSDGINSYLADLSCGNAKGNYHQIITTFIRWISKMGYLQENPLDEVDKSKRTKKMMPSVTSEQTEFLLDKVNSLRDKAIISLVFNSAMRLNELSNIKQVDIKLG